MKRYKVIDPGDWYPTIWGYVDMKDCMPEHPIKDLFTEDLQEMLTRRPKNNEIATEVLYVPYKDGRIILRFDDGKHAVINRTGLEDVTPVGRNAL